ncbi:MAG: right-handed parallel beta-helix repeat-containing protein [Ignavibacteria bacterium]|nr:right-handed parallel beta-helix repeat-containing protein [Ignavibacteria bacterium]
MRKLFLFITILLSISLAVNLWATNYYMRADGTAANKAAATGPGSTQANCMSIATHDAQTFSAGDTIFVCDDGGVFRDQMDVPSSGSDGSPIVYIAESGDTPIINSADIFTSFSESGVTGDLDAIDHDEGDFSDYASTDLSGGDLSISTAASMASTDYGMQALIDDADEMYGESSTFTWTSDTLRFRFYIDPNGSFSSSGNDIITVVSWRASASGRGYVQFGIDADTTHTIQIGFSEDDFTTAWTNAYDLLDSPNIIEGMVVRTADTTSTIDLWVNNVLKETVSALDINDVSRIDRFRIGIGLGASGVNNGRGTIYFDEFDVQDGGANSLGAKWEQKTGVTTEPLQVFYNGDRLTPNAGALGVLDNNEWDWDSDILYVNVGEDPDTGVLEASQRGRSIEDNGMDFITISNIEVRYAQYGPFNLDGTHDVIYDGLTITKPNNYAFYIEPTCYNITIQNCTIDSAGTDAGQFAISLFMTSAATISNFTIDNNTILGNGTAGGIVFQLYDDVGTFTCSNISITNNDISSVGETAAIELSIVGNFDADRTYQNVDLDSNTIHNSSAGGMFLESIRSASGTNSIRGNTIYEMSTGQSIGGIMMIDCDSMIVQYNKVYDNHTNGIDGRGIYFDIGTENSVMRYNLVYGHNDNDGSANEFHASAGLAITGVNTADSLNANNEVYSNITYGNTNGIHVSSDSVDGLKVYGNTSHDNDKDGIHIYDGLIGSELHIYNNIFFSNDRYGVWSNGAISPDIDYNLVNGNSTGNYLNINAGSNDISSAPLMTDPANADYTLTANSPCIDAGADLGATYKLALKPGSTWPSSVSTSSQYEYGRWEIGAYVYPIPDTGETTNSLNKLKKLNSLKPF